MSQSTQTATDFFRQTLIPIDSFKILVPKGMIGLHDVRHFVMRPLFPNAPEHVFWQMTSDDFSDMATRTMATDQIDIPKLSFILMAVDQSSGQPCIQGQIINVDDIDKCLSPLGIVLDECLFFLVVSIENNGIEGLHHITVNMRAPFVFHPLTKQGWQIILQDRHYPIALPLIHG